MSGQIFSNRRNAVKDNDIVQRTVRVNEMIVSVLKKKNLSNSFYRSY